MILRLFVYLNVLLYLSNAYLYFMQQGMTTVTPFYLFLVTSFVGGLMAFFKFGVTFPPKPLMRAIIWSLLFVFLGSFSYIVTAGASPEGLQMLIYYTEGVSVLVVLALLLRDPGLALHAIYAVVIVMIASVIVNYVDFFHLSPWTFSMVGGRAAGLYVNPNITGNVLVIGMCVSVFALPRALRFMYCLFILTGVLLTFSRAAIMLWGAAIIILTWFRAFVLPRLVSLSVVSGGVVLAGILLVGGAWLGILGAVGLDRYLDSNTTARISGSFVEQNDYSSRGRMEVALRGLETFLEHPVFGRGIGMGIDIDDPNIGGAHNQYVQLAAEQGIFGLLSLLGLMWVIWQGRSPTCRIFVMMFAPFCLFSHNLVQQPSTYVLIAVAVAGTVLHLEAPVRRAARRKPKPAVVAPLVKMQKPL